MAIFGFESDKEKQEQERIRRRAQQGILEEQERTGKRFKPEKGAEELDLEELVPGGAYLGMINPVGLGKKLGKEVVEEGAELAAKKGPGILKRLAEKMPGMDKVEQYYKSLAKKQRGGPTDEILKSKDELAREAKMAKIKPTEGFTYDSLGRPTVMKKKPAPDKSYDDLYQEFWNEQALPKK